MSKSILLSLIAAAGLPLATSIDLDVTSTHSIRHAAATIAYDLMAWYQNNQSSTPAASIGTLPQPLYWWEAGAVWGGLVDYWAYTGDDSYVHTVEQALMAQVGPNDNYMPPAYFSSLGNDDQAFWALAVLSAAEYGFPPPAGKDASVWVELAEAVFNTMVPRWDTATCGGGLRWQIFKSNLGYTYKNTISNGGFFQIAARLYRYTGNETYHEWADKAWNWMEGVGFISKSYAVYDGAEQTDDCKGIVHDQWTYNPGILIYGTAILHNATEGKVWADRTTGLLDSAANRLFSPFKNSTNIMYERACEPQGDCDNDQYSFKAYLSRWLAKSTVVAPFIEDRVNTLLTASARAAAESCSGGTDGKTCGQRWYVGGYDGSYGVGQQLSALETIQALLVLEGHGKGKPLHRAPKDGPGGIIKVKHD